MGLRPTNVRYWVLFGLCLAAGLAYVHRGCLSIVESTARADLGLSTRQMGWAIGIFFWAYALFQIPTGLLVDRWGARRALTLFGLLGAVTVAMSAGTLWVDAATGFVILIVARVLMGIAQAGLFPASTRALSVWIPLRRRAVAAGILQASMSVGGAAGAFLTAQLLGVVSWPWVFLIYAGPGVAWSVLFFAWYRDRPDEHRLTNEAERGLLREERIGRAADENGLAMFAALASFPVVCLCAQQFFRAGANVFWFTWCPTYLQNTHQLGVKEAGSLTSLPIVGVVLGAILGGWVADRVLLQTGSRRLSRAGTAIVASGLGALLFCLTMLVPSGQAVLGVSVLVLAATVVSCSNSCGYSAAMDLGGRNLATVFAAMNMFGNFGAALFSQVVPYWVEWFDWPAVVLLVAGAYACGLVCWIPLDPDPANHGGRASAGPCNEGDSSLPETDRR